MTETLTLRQFSFNALRRSEGLSRLDQLFLSDLKAAHPRLHDVLLRYRHQKNTLSSIETSELLIRCAIFLEQFIAGLFDIEEALDQLSAKTTSLNPLSQFKKYYILRRAKKEPQKAKASVPLSELNHWLEGELKKAPLQAPDRELHIALLGLHYLNEPEKYATEIETLTQWCIAVLADPETQKSMHDWTLFKIPKRLDYDNLVPTDAECNHQTHFLKTSDHKLRLRDGFKLTDPRMNLRAVQDEANYCIYCHNHEGDFCSKGFPVKKNEPEKGFKKNPLDITLTGCPLDEKISEMNYLRKEGHTLAALAVIMIDNPMCPATGHRICNDCMKACIYQKQEPVDIPQIETRILTDVLHLPWGVEIYDLLTRFNPLRQTQWIMKPYNGLKVLIAGMGPAGFTLAHHLLLEGFAVVGTDGLKIEPLPKKWIDQPIYRYQDLEESLDERLIAGFGGVAEYGITVRWDKNFLKLIYLSLMRKPYFHVFGNARLGGTLTTEDPWEMGFDHFALAVGAGLPEALPIPGSMARGMRQANDFLMSLQLGNAAKKDSITNLQIRLPALIIGGGLTAVDTATEVQAYYIAQVEKISERYHALDKAAVHQALDVESEEILTEFLAHADAIKAERLRAKKANEKPNFIKLIRTWGGVSIVYRRTVQESKAYLLNHEELKKALEEGIYFIEGMAPHAVQVDQYGSVKALSVNKQIRSTDGAWHRTNVILDLPARSILVATGTRPNTAYEYENRGTFLRKNRQYLHYEDQDGILNEVKNVPHCKSDPFGPFTSYQKNNRRISLIGDTHPVFHGSVVKAIASGARTYLHIVNLFKNQLGQKGDDEEYRQFANGIVEYFQSEVLTVERKTSNMLEITIRAPHAIKHFLPGQFYRLQNFETYTQTDAMEPIALPVAECDPINKTLTLIVNEDNAMTTLCQYLKPGEPVALMGPTGVRTDIPITHEKILIIGDSKSIAFVRGVGAALKNAGNQVIVIYQYQNQNDLYCKDQMKAVVDTFIAHHNNGIGIEALLTTYLEKNTLHTINRIFLVGAPSLLKSFQANHNQLFDRYFHAKPKVYGSVDGNMQCMLKGVCAQCLQWQIDPQTGKRTKAVFACSWQNQPLEMIDIDHLRERLNQNPLMDVMNRLWIKNHFAH